MGPAFPFSNEEYNERKTEFITVSEYRRKHFRDRFHLRMLRASMGVGPQADPRDLPDLTAKSPHYPLLGFAG